MAGATISSVERPDAAFSVLQELKRFLAHAQLRLTRDRRDCNTLYMFQDRSNLKTTADAVRDDRRLRKFIEQSATLTEELALANQLAIGPAGPSVEGVGLERILIAYDLASRYGQEQTADWVEGRSGWRRDITQILSFFSQMAQRRYEKSTPQMTVAYYPAPLRAGIGYGQLGKPLLDEYKALLRLCRDAHTVLVVHQGSVISGLLAGFGRTAADADDVPPIPPRLEHLRNLSHDKHENPPIVFNLNANGSMEILAKAELAFRRVNNIWRFTNLSGALEAIQKTLGMAASSNPAQVAHNFLSLALDLADRGEGALLFLCDEPTTDVLDRLLDSRDGIIRKLPGLPYQELSARTRFTQLVGNQQLSLQNGAYRQLSPLLRDLCSIDGATLFSYRGQLLGFGCIVKVGTDALRVKIGVRQEGARSAAAKAVSQRGIAIKVSTDGDATLYLHGVEWGTFC